MSATTENNTDRYVVFGNPVMHSKSPFIHRAFAVQTGQSVHYDRQQAPLDDFAGSLNPFRQLGGRGCNVTVPFKEQAWQLVDQRSGLAERAGAVNTIAFLTDGQMMGHNTDGTGLCRDLQQNHQVPLAQKRLLLLGAGGAVRGVLEPLLQCAPEQVFIANRTAAKAEQLGTLFADLGPVAGGGYEQIDGCYDVIINGTAASLQGDLPPLPDGCLRPGGVCYDMMYAAEPTPFLRWGSTQQAGCLLDGLGMLVEQAADAFAIWRGVRPQTDSVLQELRQTLQA